MAPIRRYLRITKYSVLECRIYLDNPALAQSWLLNPRNPVLPRVIASVRPLVLPKLREEKERARKKSTKKKSIKDEVVEDDFEVSIFLTETDTRHSILYKHKHFRDKKQTKLKSNSDKLVGASRDVAIDVDNDTSLQLDQDAPVPTLLREASSTGDDVVALEDIPAINEDLRSPHARPAKRTRASRSQNDSDGGEITDSGDEASDDSMFVASDEDLGEDEADAAASEPPAKRHKGANAAGGEADDKKKLAMDVSYEGFSIYGRVLCLVVKRRETGSWPGASSASAAKSKAANGPAGGGQAVMENWITSTQIPPEEAAPEDAEAI